MKYLASNLPEFITSTRCRCLLFIIPGRYMTTYTRAPNKILPVLIVAESEPIILGMHRVIIQTRGDLVAICVILRYIQVHNIGCRK